MMSGIVGKHISPMEKLTFLRIQKQPKAKNDPKKCAKISNLAVGGPGMVLGGPQCIWRKFRSFLRNF